MIKVHIRLSKSSNIGKLIILIGVLLLFPLLIIPFFPEDIIYAGTFIVPSLFSILLGLIICICSKPNENNMQAEEMIHRGNLTVLLAWGYSFLAGAMPFVLARKLTFIQALFEAVSGWTTTGLSTMDVTITPHIFLFHRSFMQFCGGLGFVMVMILFIQGKQAMNLYNAEGHPDKIMPNLRQTVRAIFAVYISCLIVGVIAYVLCGMPIFDSILHTMGALSTGGFSNMTDSIGAYHNIGIEAVTIVLMLIGTTNFALLLLLVRRKLGQVFRAGELRFLGALLLIFVPLTAISLTAGLYISFSEGLRQALFNIVSALSTTGYSTMSYMGWPQFALGVMILMMLIGGGIGSTAGGIKLSRVLIMLKATWQNVKSKVSAEHEIKTPFYYRAQGKTQITDSLIKSTAGFITSYLTIFIIGSLLLTVTAGASLTDAMFEFASSLGTVGLSIGITGTTTNSATLIVEICGMVLGRLEIFIVLTGIYSAFSVLFRKKKKPVSCSL